MQLLIDLATMAVMHSSGVPLTDLALVRGDKLPLRITLLDDGVPVTPSGVRPALAVKTSLASGTLVLAATDLEPVDDALGMGYVGSLSVNTTQLAETMGQEDRMELVGELVLISGDGSQRTSSLIRVSVRQDIMPADIVPPQDVITDWEEMVAVSLTAQLPDALQAAGVNITPVTGSSTLSTGEAETPTVMACYAMSWGDELLAGHLTESCRLRRVTMTYYTDTGLMDAHWMRVWRLEGGKYVVIGLATAVALPANNQPIAWDFAPGVSLRKGDKIMLEICAGQDAAHLTTHGLGVHAVITPPKDGRGLASSISYPPEITMATMAPMMSVTVAYDEGVSVGGVELATATQVQALGADVRTAAANSQAAAQSTAASRDQAQESAQTASDAATASQQALAAMPVDAAGNITAQGGTFARTVNANGGVNIPLTAAPSVQTHAVNRVLAGGMAVVADACNPQVFLSSKTTYGSSVFVTDVVPNFLWQLKNSASGSSPVNGTVRVGFDSTLVGRSNYGTIWGYVIPYRPASSKHKVTFTVGMYRESECVISSEQPIDTFTVSPKSSNKSSWLRLIDITFYNEMDSSAAPVGYPVRVREIVYDKINDKWVVYTTVSVISAFNTQPNNAQAIVYQQNPDDTGCRAGLWLIVQGAAGQRTLRLADLHGVSDSFGWDTMSPVWWDAGYGSAHIGAPRVTQVYSPDRVNGVYHAFAAIESRQIQSTSSADFNHYD